MILLTLKQIIVYQYYKHIFISYLFSIFSYLLLYLCYYFLYYTYAIHPYPILCTLFLFHIPDQTLSIYYLFITFLQPFLRFDQMYYLLLFLVITYHSLVSISFYYLLHSLGIRPYQTLRAILVFLLIDTFFVPHSLSIVVYVEDLSILYLLVLILSNPGLTVKIVLFPYMPFSNLSTLYLILA